jgi:hypothetical protein
MKPTTDHDCRAARARVDALRLEFEALEQLTKDPDRALARLPDLIDAADLSTRARLAWSTWFDETLQLIRAEHARAFPGTSRK